MYNVRFNSDGFIGIEYYRTHCEESETQKESCTGSQIEILKNEYKQL